MLAAAQTAVRQLQSILSGPAGFYTVDAAISACTRKVVQCFDCQERQLNRRDAAHRTRHRRQHRVLLRRLAEGWIAHRRQADDADDKLRRAMRSLAEHMRFDRCAAS